LIAAGLVHHPLGAPQKKIVFVGMDVTVQTLACLDVAHEALARLAAFHAQHDAARVENDLDGAYGVALDLSFYGHVLPRPSGPLTSSVSSVQGADAEANRLGLRVNYECVLASIC
jgi:hypothetical protein